MIKLDADFIRHFKSIIGAFSVAEAIGLYQIIQTVPNGIFAELGTHKGKSGSVLAYGLPEGVLHLIDPEFKDKEWEKEARYNINRHQSHKIDVLYHATTSLEFIPTILNQEVSLLKEYAFIFIDSSIHDDMVMGEVKAMENLICKGGIIAFHDYLNQFSAVERAYNYLLSTNKYEPIFIDWQEIFDYVAENNLEEGNNSWHLYPELPHPPNFIGAVKRK